jgi:hypothetical protein
MSHTLRCSLSNLWVYLSVSVSISVVLWVLIGMVLSGYGVVSSAIQGAACGLAVGAIMYHSQYGSET